MIELIDISSPRAVGAKISGKIEKPDLDQVIAAIEQKLLRVDKIGIYLELESFGGISFRNINGDKIIVLIGIGHFNRINALRFLIQLTLSSYDFTNLKDVTISGLLEKRF